MLPSLAEKTVVSMPMIPVRRACRDGSSLRAVVVIAFASLLACGPCLAAQPLRIGGTGNALGTLQRLGEAFQKQNPDIAVKVLPSLGTSGALKAVPQGALDIGASARPLLEEEAKRGLVALEYARTPLVFAVSRRTGVTAITLAQVADVYNGKMASWPGGTPTRPVLRQPNDDNTQQMRRMSPALDQALAVAEKRAGLPFATTDQEAADKAEGIPGALVLTTLGLIRSEGRALQPLTLDGVEPTVENAASGRYPHAKRLYLVTRAEPSALVKRFVEFTRSPAAREILANAGHWTP